MDYISVFSYNYDNILLATPGIIDSLVGIIFVCLLLLITYYLNLWFLGLNILMTEASALQRKKNILKDLILMKDIQVELETEIEQSILKSAFQH